MAQAFDIPLTPGINQRFKTTLNGVEYTIDLNWNKVSKLWVMDIYNTDITISILRGIPLVTGTNLLGQYPYTEPGLNGGMVVMTIGPGESPDEIPTFENLGTDGHLYFVTLP